MIPEFPNFKNLEYSDKSDVENFTKKYIPHSDFNFMGMWTWDVDDQRKLSVLNGNLVMRTTDYITGAFFYAYLGDNNISDTAQKLLECSKKEGLEKRLRLISEDSIVGIDLSKFKVEEDRDHFDYILDNEILVKYEGSDLRGHASFKRRFVEGCGGNLTVKALTLSDAENQKSILSLNERWSKHKVSNNKDTSAELSEDKAIKKIFSVSKDNISLVSIGVFHNGELIAYTIDEIVHDNSLIRHFMKADATFKGVYSYLVSESARILLEIGKKYVNLEQDLGLKNLRQSKKSYMPVKFAKKYIVTELN